MKWFCEVFLQSFPDCNGKCISEKQAEIFIRYLSNSSELDNAFYYEDKINCRNIKLQESLVYNGCRYTNKGRHTSYKKKYYLIIATEKV